METYNGMEVVVTEMATRVVEVRPYLKTRNMTLAKISRMRKKWHKWYGTKVVPVIYRVKLGMKEQICIHPECYDAFIAFTKAAERLKNG